MGALFSLVEGCIYRQRAKDLGLKWWRYFLGGMEPSHIGAVAQMGVADSCLSLSELYLMCRAVYLEVSCGLPSFGMPCAAGVFRAVLQVQSRALGLFLGFLWAKVFGAKKVLLFWAKGILFQAHKGICFLYFIIGAFKECSRPGLGCLQ